MAPCASTGGDSSGCLQGTVFGLTGELPRKELTATLRTHGAKVSAIVHRRVSYVLCTDDAVRNSTQKVRKALKHGIPLVSQDFIAACALARGAIDPAPFRITASSAGAPTGTTAKPSASEAPPASGSDAPVANKLTGTDRDDSASPRTQTSPAAAVVKGEAGTRRPKQGSGGGADAARGYASEKRRKTRRHKAGELAPTEDVRLGAGAERVGLVTDGGGGGGGSGGEGGGGGCAERALPGIKKKEKRKRRNGGDDAHGVSDDPLSAVEGEATRDGIKRQSKFKPKGRRRRKMALGVMPAEMPQKKEEEEARVEE